jgi:hypothetical protein
MFIIPFIHTIVQQNNINQTSINVNVIKILTIGGKLVWEESDLLDIDNDILKPNDLHLKGRIIKLNNNTYLCEIDTSKINIDNFYKWEEIPYTDNDTFCWRSYVQLIDNKNNNWLNIPNSEKLGNISVKTIISKIFEKKENNTK